MQSTDEHNEEQTGELSPYQLFQEKLEENQIQLDIEPNIAMKWLIDEVIKPGSVTREILVCNFNYSQWIILIPGFAALYFYSWLIGSIVLALCFVLGFLVINKLKRVVLKGGIRSFLLADLTSLEALYKVGAVRFRKGKKEKWIRYPQAWQDVLNVK